MKMRTKRASAVTILSFFKNERIVTATPPCFATYINKDLQISLIHIIRLTIDFQHLKKVLLHEQDGIDQVIHRLVSVPVKHDLPID